MAPKVLSRDVIEIETFVDAELVELFGACVELLLLQAAASRQAAAGSEAIIPLLGILIMCATSRL
jgi:hypothetical protein